MNFLTDIWNWILSLLGLGYSAPAGGVWKCAMFFPWKLYGTNSNPPWSGNRGVDSNQGYASDHGNSWENTKRLNGFKWVQAMGGDTTMFIAERLYGRDVPHLELQMYLTNRTHPDGSGKQMQKSENFVLQARDYGIKRWVISLFDSPGSMIPVAAREDYIKQMCECYAWATSNEVAFLVGLECNRNMTVDQVKQIINWLKQYGNGKRIIVGSSNAAFLQACSGNDVELWTETDWHPFDTTMGNADAYLAKLRDLQKYGIVWAGEFGNPNDVTTVKYITDKTLAMGCSMGCGKFN